MSLSEFIAAYYTISDNFLYYLGLLLLNDIICFVVFGLMKWHWLRIKGVSLEDRSTIFSNRKIVFDLQRLIHTYPERTLLIIDGISRKSKHIIVNIPRLILLTVILKNPILSTQLIILRGIIEICALVVSRNSNTLLGLGGLFFGAMSRIRDGVKGRLNYITSSSMSLLGLVCFTFFVFVYKSLGVPDQTIMHIGQFTYIPLTVGDALGEIVGSLWGVQKIRVWGVGEINRKSILGTNAVFFGALLPMCFIVYFSALSMAWFGLVLLIAVNSALVELFAPRSTDNCFIPVSNSLWILLFVFWFMD